MKPQLESEQHGENLLWFSAEQLLLCSTGEMLPLQPRAILQLRGVLQWAASVLQWFCVLRWNTGRGCLTANFSDVLSKKNFNFTFRFYVLWIFGGKKLNFFPLYETFVLLEMAIIVLKMSLQMFQNCITLCKTFYKSFSVIGLFLFPA